MMENPFTSMRQALNMSIQDFSLFLDVSYSTIYAVEAGRSRGISKYLLNRLNQKKINTTQLITDYKTWREQLKKEML